MIRFALVGCGRIAAKYAEILSSGAVPDAKMVAACDIRPDRAAAIGTRYNIPTFVDMHQMMEVLHGQIDVIAILTESGNHARHAIALASYGKMLLVEKPMALTLADADEMIRVCDAARVRLSVVKQNRYNLPVVKLRQALDAGRFGRLVMGTVRVRWSRPQSYYDQDAWRGTWAMDGGVFANQASHHVDLLEWMLGEPASVFAYARTALVDIEAEDTGVALIKFRNGALGLIEATTACRPRDLEGSVSILGERGSVEIGGFAVNQMKVWEFVDKTPDDDDVLTQSRENPPDVYGFGHIRYLNEIIKAIREDAPLLVDGLEGRKSLELITAIYESIETSREVALRLIPTKCRLGVG